MGVTSSASQQSALTASSADRRAVLKEADQVDITFVTACYYKAVATFAEKDGLWTRGKTRGSRRPPSSQRSTTTMRVEHEKPGATEMKHLQSHPRTSIAAPKPPTFADVTKANVPDRLLVRALYNHIFTIPALTETLLGEEHPTMPSLRLVAPQWGHISLPMSLFDAFSSKKSLLLRTAEGRETSPSRLPAASSLPAVIKPSVASHAAATSVYSAVQRVAPVKVVVKKKKSAKQVQSTKTITLGRTPTRTAERPSMIAAKVKVPISDMSSNASFSEDDGEERDEDPIDYDKFRVEMQAVDRERAKLERNLLISAGVIDPGSAMRVYLPPEAVAAIGLNHMQSAPDLQTSRVTTTARDHWGKTPRILNNSVASKASGLTTTSSELALKNLSKSGVTKSSSTLPNAAPKPTVMPTFDGLATKAKATVHAGELFTSLALYCKGSLEDKAAFLYAMYATRPHVCGAEASACSSSNLLDFYGFRRMLEACCCVWCEIGELPSFPTEHVLKECCDNLQTFVTTNLASRATDGITPNEDDIIPQDVFLEWVKELSTKSHELESGMHFESMVAKAHKRFAKEDGLPMRLPSPERGKAATMVAKPAKCVDLPPSLVHLLNTPLCQLTLAVYLSSQLHGIPGFVRSRLATAHMSSAVEKAIAMATQAQHDTLLAHKLKSPVSLLAKVPSTRLKLGNPVNVAAHAGVSLDYAWCRICLAAESPSQAAKIAAMPASIKVNLKHSSVSMSMNLARTLLHAVIRSHGGEAIDYDKLAKSASPPKKEVKIQRRKVNTEPESIFGPIKLGRRLSSVMRQHEDGRSPSPSGTSPVPPEWDQTFVDIRIAEENLKSAAMTLEKAWEHVVVADMINTGELDAEVSPGKLTLRQERAFQAQVHRKVKQMVNFAGVMHSTNNLEESMKAAGAGRRRSSLGSAAQPVFSLTHVDATPRKPTAPSPSLSPSPSLLPSPRRASTLAALPKKLGAAVSKTMLAPTSTSAFGRKTLPKLSQRPDVISGLQLLLSEPD